MDTPPTGLHYHDAAEVGRAIFEEVSDALFLLDPETDALLDVNPAAEKLTGVPRERLFSQPATYWFRAGAPGRGGNQRLRRAVSDSGVFHSQEGFFLRAASFWIPVNLTVSRLHLKPKTLGLIIARDLREQRAAHTRLQEAEQELRRVLASIPDCLWSAEVEPSGGWAFRYFSPVVTRLTGRPPEAFLGGPAAWEQVIYPEDRPGWQKSLARLRAGQPGHQEYRVVRADGVVRWLHESVLVSAGLKAGALRLDGVLTDVTEARLAAEERDRLFELSLDMLCVAGFDGYFKRLNPAWERSLGWSREDLLSRPYLEFVHPDDREITVAEAARLSTGNHQTVLFENRYRCRDGSYKWLLWNAAPFPAGQLVYAAARDITRRRQQQEELRRTAEELARAVTSEREAHRELRDAQAQLVQAEKLAALGQMVAGVAHEVNNPLAFVINNIEVLRRDLGGMRQALRLYKEAEADVAAGRPEPFRQVHEYAQEIDLSYIEDNLDRLLSRSTEGMSRIRQIVKDLRDFARLDESELKEADLNEGVRSTLNIVRGRATRKGIELDVSLGALPPVLCYPAKVNQVVLNLLANAIDACPDNGKILVRTRAADDGVEIHVIDNGHGIDPEIRDKIFDPFFTTKPPGQGTGLGLSISHGIAQDHGGRIEVESVPEQGAHFTVRLPLRPPPTGQRRSP